MQPNRRELLKIGLGSSALLATGGTVPAFLANAASALGDQPERRNRERILVVVQLDGGNDGLNSVVPFTDPVYQRSRPSLRLGGDRLHRINNDIALHPSLRQMMDVHEDQKLSIIQSVGYPNPNRSHFRSMAIWHTGRTDPDRATPGWLARTLDRNFNAPGGDSPALHINDSLLPQALHGCQRHVPSLTNLDHFRRRLGIEGNAAAQRQALDQISRQQSGSNNSLLQFVERTSVVTYTSSARLDEALRRQRGNAEYPEFYALARKLKLIGQLIKADLNTRIYYTQLGGFDTHSNQANTHSGLMQQLANSLKAFQTDMTQSGDAERVMVVVFSEFGRRLRENASAGTDHGTAGPVFLMGARVRPGLHGPNPNLQNLQDGDPRFAIDFRRIYATLLDQWLRCPSQAILGERYQALPVLRA